MWRGSFLAPSFNRTSPLFSFFTKFPLLSIFRSVSNNFRCPLLHYHSCHFPKPLHYIQAYQFAMDRRARFCSFAHSTTPQIHESSVSGTNKVSRKSNKKARQESPEWVLKWKLDSCSKSGDLVEALRLYDEARSNGIQLTQHHYNVLLYLCSSGSSVELKGDRIIANASDLSFKRGFEIYQQMVTDKVAPNEATFTNVARLAFASEDPEMAFDLVKKMKGFDILPKLRSYGPALFGFCKKGMADRAYEVDTHMAESEVIAEEPELSALLKVSADAKRVEKVYEMLHRLRYTVRQVSDSTIGIIEDWFKSEDASKLGKQNWDVNKVREGIVRGGGGWHGQGWLGSGEWKTVRTKIDEQGICCSCGQKLVCIDIDPRETENFATSLANLACRKEVKADFVLFQEWLKKHGPFDAVIDGANLGLVKQKTFSFYQLNSVVGEVRQMSPSKRLPLIILHRSRVTGGPAQNPNNKKLLEFWKKSGALYSTPAGSNDDWYWLYAAVSCKCLLVTNDEMRDHLFQLLGTSFFPRWKEKHQVRVSVSRSGPALHMPPPCSIVIQESENGSWHIPTVTDDLETRRQWLCATRERHNYSDNNLAVSVA
ncbi:proteinaceous RNase P 1, chloroplastic/mitochondrial isoform X2 [Jatropha curcas]|uniref:proteinaceous RNase P 1, chloroplastic/mitochondrial isoform X2 n=1 Tax=Jatropha curcas TaxID=180498 RepID=UPI0018951ADE|nr:proteinaceous RNase P 1, chloroplastic/mitochondrial isoform X2 [Jatropha curcas]